MSGPPTLVSHKQPTEYCVQLDANIHMFGHLNVQMRNTSMNIRTSKIRWKVSIVWADNGWSWLMGHDDVWCLNIVLDRDSSNGYDRPNSWSFRKCCVHHLFVLWIINDKRCCFLYSWVILVGINPMGVGKKYETIHPNKTSVNENAK